ncbi:hypothetical protein JW921_00650, partial [Candidatus Fermentibacterales bacterium]|nr:hypothetical protein [Candidatus Fermentibacterales bacterium]
MTYEVVQKDKDRNRVLVRFHEDGERVDSLFREVRKSLLRDVSLPGFRKGRIPRSVIDSKYGNMIRSEVGEKLRTRLIEHALDEQDWILADEAPGGETTLPSEGKPFEFEAELTLFSEVKPKGYKKLTLKKMVGDLDSAVERTLQDLRTRFASYENVERTCRDGDIVVLEEEGERQAETGKQPEKAEAR